MNRTLKLCCHVYNGVHDFGWFMDDWEPEHSSKYGSFLGSI